MVIKLYISGISGNKEVKKKQQRVQMILDSKQISYEAIDITEPGKEKDKEFMQQNGKVRESLGKHPLPPQIFNDDDFCGDYEDFDMANEVDELEKFLHIETKDSENGVKCSEDSWSIKSKQSGNSMYDPYDYHTVKITWDRVNGVSEQIIVNDKPVDENNETGETTKSEVNGETETVTSSQPEMTLDTEASNENVPAPEKEEEVAAEENNEEEKVEEKTEEEKKEEDVEAEEEETKVEEEVDKAKEEEEEEEEVEKAEETPQVEEEEKAKEKEEEEEDEGDEEKNEKEESDKEEDKESGRESPQSEKSEDD